MAADSWTTTALTTILGGGILASIFTFVRDRRKDKVDYTIATYQTLASMNDRLKSEIDDLRTQHRTEMNDIREEHRVEVSALTNALEAERRQRRRLEDRVAQLERQAVE